MNKKMRKEQLKKQREKVFMLLQDGLFWSPLLTDIAVKTNTPNSSVGNIFKRMMKQGKFSVRVDYVFDNTTQKEDEE